MGTGNQWPGVFLAERKVVVVTFNYRLNALGMYTDRFRYTKLFSVNL